MKKYWTSLTSTYVPDWSAPEAVREILQNFLDSPSGFEYDFSGDTLEFTNKGITLHQSTILMGSTSKRDELDSVGGKGEGYKLACLVLLREGYGVTIYNGSKLWIPAIEFNEDYEADCLVFNETERSSGNDLTFEISGVGESLTSEIVDKCLYLQKDLGEVLEGTRGRVLKDKPNMLYVGGLWVCDISSKYSYDFHPQYLPLNRDRKSVSGWDLAKNTTVLLEEVMPVEELVKLTIDKTVDAGSYYGRFKSDDVAEGMYEHFKEEFGATAVVAEDYNEEEKLTKRGYKNVRVVYNSNQRELIKQAPSYKEFLEELGNVVEPEDSRSPLEVLEEWYNDICDVKLTKFEQILETFRERGVSWDA